MYIDIFRRVPSPISLPVLPVGEGSCLREERAESVRPTPLVRLAGGLGHGGQGTPSNCPAMSALILKPQDDFGGEGSTVIPFTSLADVGAIPGRPPTRGVATILTHSAAAALSEESIDQLVEMMAIDRSSAEAALRLHKGDISGAVDWIIGGMYAT